jgi:hypothetical protein
MFIDRTLVRARADEDVFLFALFLSFSHMSFVQYADNNKNDERQEKKKKLTLEKKNYRIDSINKQLSFEYIYIKKS